MRKLSILFLDWGLSRDKTESALAAELGYSVFNFTQLLREQISKKDELGIEMAQLLDQGQLLPQDLIAKFLSVNLQAMDGNVLLSGFPRKIEHFRVLEGVLDVESMLLNEFWYFRIRNPRQFRKSHFGDPDLKPWVEKYGKEVITKWKQSFDEKRRQIGEIKSTTDRRQWQFIEVDYIANVTEENCREYIRNHLLATE